MTLLSTRAMRLRRNLIILVILVTVGYTALQGPIDDLLTPPCDEALVLHPDLPLQTAAQLALLHELDLLYCPAVPSGLAGFVGPLYWGTDGVNSLLYFAYAPDNPLTIGRYGIMERPALGMGDAGPLGLAPVGRPTYRNEAPEGVPAYLVSAGAPRAGEVKVELNVRGRGEPQQGLTNRDFWTDMENVLRRLRREPNTTEDGRLDLTFAIVPRRWEGVAVAWSDPVLDATGTTDFRDAALEPPTEPTLARVVSGPLGAGAWVAAVVSGTRPALVVIPDDATSAPIEPVSVSMWRGRETLFALFSLPMLTAQTPYRVEYWTHADERESGAPADFVSDSVLLGVPEPDG